MNTKGYTVFGWLAWKLLSRVVPRQIAKKRMKFGAAATVIAVLAAGIAAARASSGSE